MNSSILEFVNKLKSSYPQIELHLNDESEYTERINSNGVSVKGITLKILGFNFFLSVAEIQDLIFDDRISENSFKNIYFEELIFEPLLKLYIKETPEFAKIINDFELKEGEYNIHVLFDNDRVFWFVLPIEDIFSKNNPNLPEIIKLNTINYKNGT